MTGDEGDITQYTTGSERQPDDLRKMDTRAATQTAYPGSIIYTLSAVIADLLCLAE
jgi:hypothetical protein